MEVSGSLEVFGLRNPGAVFRDPMDDGVESLESSLVRRVGSIVPHVHPQALALTGREGALLILSDSYGGGGTTSVLRTRAKHCSWILLGSAPS